MSLRPTEGVQGALHPMQPQLDAARIKGHQVVEPDVTLRRSGSFRLHSAHDCC